MTLCINNPVVGNNMTDNFTFDEVNKQVVPKAGTDTKPGALALNIGNVPGDTTNATDALTAAGFNAMATAVDTVPPICGNEMQQAITAAVAQAIGCDAAAQQAIGCAIASNPDAIACLSAVLPSGVGNSCAGSLRTYTTDNSTPGKFVSVLFTDGTAGTPVESANAGGAQSIIRAGTRPIFISQGQDPFVSRPASYSVNTATGAVTEVSVLPALDVDQAWIVLDSNKTGTKLLVARSYPAGGTNQRDLVEFQIDAGGNLVSPVTLAVAIGSILIGKRFYRYDDAGDIRSYNPVRPYGAKLVAGSFVPVAGLLTSSIVSPNGQFALTNTHPTILHSVSGSTATLVNVSNTVSPAPAPVAINGGITWAPDSSHAILSLVPSTGKRVLYYVDVTSGQAVIKPNAILEFAGSNQTGSSIEFSATGKYFTAGSAPDRLQIFKFTGSGYIQCSETSANGIQPSSNNTVSFEL